VSVLNHIDNTKQDESICPFFDIMHDVFDTTCCCCWSWWREYNFIFYTDS